MDFCYFGELSQQEIKEKETADSVLKFKLIVQISNWCSPILIGGNCQIYI